MKNTSKGFTLVELLVVIAILAILATVSVVGYTSYIATTEETAAKSEAASIADAIEVALVMNKVACIEKKAYVPAVADDTSTPDVDETKAAVDGEYIIFTRQADGSYEVTTGTQPEGVIIKEIPANLIAGLSRDNAGNLLYTSAKDVVVNVKTGEVK